MRNSFGIFSIRMLLQVIIAYRVELSESPRCVVALLRSSITYGDLHIMEQLLVLLPGSSAAYKCACSGGLPPLTQAVLLDCPIAIIQLLLSASVIACAIDTPVSSDVARVAGISLNPSQATRTAVAPSAKDTNRNSIFFIKAGDTALHTAIRRGRVPVVRLLLLNGADVHQRVMVPLINRFLKTFQRPDLFAATLMTTGRLAKYRCDDRVQSCSHEHCHFDYCEGG